MCVGYYFDDEGLVNREDVKLFNNSYGFITLNYKRFKKYFSQEMDTLKIAYHDSLYNRYIEINETFRLQAEIDSIRFEQVKLLISKKYNGKYYALKDFSDVNRTDVVSIDGVSNVSGPYVDLVVRHGSNITTFNCTYVLMKNNNIRLADKFSEYFSEKRPVIVSKSTLISKIRLGMKYNEVIAVLGHCDRPFNTVSSWGSSSQLYYDKLGLGVICVNGVVTSIFDYPPF